MKGKRLAYCFNGHHRLRYENHKDFCIHFDSNQRHFISYKIELTHLYWHLPTSRSSFSIAPFQHRRRLESAKYLLLSKIVKTKLQWNSFLIRRKTFKLPTSITAYTVWREWDEGCSSSILNKLHQIEFYIKIFYPLLGVRECATASACWQSVRRIPLTNCSARLWIAIKFM